MAQEENEIGENKYNQYLHQLTKYKTYLDVL
uniref:Uncharacterized protein n=1 Tax=Nelumbo nucifera TaxID=4432 RepID=A0A822ZVV5_NELNU|nr:TPA_asm: hypothetical protein HUJ06_017598 [Nelumbo nucifera]